MKQAGAPQYVGLEQHVDGMPLEGDGESRAGQRPGDVDPPDAMDGASDSWKVRMEPGQAIAVIEMPPAPVRDMIAEGSRSATFGTNKGGVASMCEPEVEVVQLGIERNAFDSPGFFQSQEF